MATRTPEPEAPPNLAEMIERLGGIPLERVWTRPPPGTATEEDLLAAAKLPRGKLLELVDGILVEKAVGTREGLLGGILVYYFWDYLKKHKLGKALPGDALLRLVPGLVRAPDVAFVSWANMPGGKFPKTPIASIVPDLAVEVLSKGNTRKEIDRKLKDYFLSGTRLAWVIDPRKETAKVYHAPDEMRRVSKTGTLDGEDVLPGFSLKLPDLFAQADEEAPPG